MSGKKKTSSKTVQKNKQNTYIKISIGNKKGKSKGAAPARPQFIPLGGGGQPITIINQQPSDFFASQANAFAATQSMISNLSKEMQSMKMHNPTQIESIDMQGSLIKQQIMQNAPEKVKLEFASRQPSINDQATTPVKSPFATTPVSQPMTTQQPPGSEASVSFGGIIQSSTPSVMRKIDEELKGMQTPMTPAFGFNTQTQENPLFQSRLPQVQETASSPFTPPLKTIYRDKFNEIMNEEDYEIKKKQLRRFGQQFNTEMGGDETLSKYLSAPKQGRGEIYPKLQDHIDNLINNMD